MQYYKILWTEMYILKIKTADLNQITAATYNIL